MKRLPKRRDVYRDLWGSLWVAMKLTYQDGKWCWTLRLIGWPKRPQNRNVKVSTLVNNTIYQRVGQNYKWSCEP